MPIGFNNHRATFKKSLIANIVEQQRPKKGFEGFFPRERHDTAMLAINVMKMGRKAAVDVVRCTDPHMNTFSRTAENLYIPPQYFEGFDVCKCDGYWDTFGSADGGFSGGRMIQLANSSLNKTSYLIDMIERSIEIQRIQVLTTGVVQLKNGDSIDYGRLPASMKVLTGADEWDTATANIIKDIKDGCEFLRTTGLSTANEVNAIMGGAAFENMMSNEKFQKDFDIRRIDRGFISSPVANDVTGMVYQGQFSTGDFRVNIFTYNETYENAAGVSTRFLDDNTVILLPNDFTGQTAFAANEGFLGEGMNARPVLIKDEYLISDLLDTRKASWEILVKSSPLAIPYEVNKIYTLKTAGN